MKRASAYASFIILGYLLSCSVSNETLKERLNQIAASDLSDITQEIKDRGADSVLSEKPEYQIVEFKVFKGDSGRMFKAYACVHYYYLKSLKLYQKRKYRYNTVAHFWDRYDIKLKHYYKDSGEKEQRKPLNTKS